MKIFNEELAQIIQDKIDEESAIAYNKAINDAINGISIYLNNHITSVNIENIMDFGERLKFQFPHPRNIVTTLQTTRNLNLELIDLLLSLKKD